MAARKALFVEEKPVKSPEILYHLDLAAAWLLPGEINPMKNCSVHSDWGLTTMSGEVEERFTALLSPFDCTHRPVCGGKVGQVT